LIIAEAGLKPRRRRLPPRPGYFGDTRLDGVSFARLYWWPGPIHEGNGVRRTIIDEKASKEQRDALIALDSGQHERAILGDLRGRLSQSDRGAFCPITFNVDREKRVANIRIPGIAESETEPIKNPASGEEHRARIVLPNGFEYKEAEMGNTVSCRVSAGNKLTFELKNTYAQLNAFDWSNRRGIATKSLRSSGKNCFYSAFRYLAA
jgi:hypothetical protein